MTDQQQQRLGVSSCAPPPLDGTSLTSKMAEAASNSDSHMIVCVVRLLLVFQLLEYIGGGIVHWNKARVGTVHDMAASEFLFTEESPQSHGKLLCCSPSYPEW